MANVSRHLTDPNYRDLPHDWLHSEVEFMGDELAKVVALGYSVFHDFPGGPNWNIDPIAVGPGSVFAIETKTRRREPLP